MIAKTNRKLLFGFWKGDPGESDVIDIRMKPGVEIIFDLWMDEMDEGEWLACTPDGKGFTTVTLDDFDLFSE